MSGVVTRTTRLGVRRSKRRVGKKAKAANTPPTGKFYVPFVGMGAPIHTIY